MPQTALNYTQTQQEQENSCKIIQFPKRQMCFAQMESTEETVLLDDIADKANGKVKTGMDYFPQETYNQLIEYSLEHGKFRNAMLMVCMANWGMRYSDVVRVRFAHLFDRNGIFRDSFTLPNGERKTSKAVIYYNNEATETIISLYLQQPENKRKSRLDYLFVSESQAKNMPVASVQQLEAEDLYDYQIKIVQKALTSIPDTEKRLLEKYIKGKISDDNFKYMTDVIKVDRQNLEKHLSDLVELKKDYVSATPNAENIFIQKPLTHTAGENIIKDTLQKIGIFPKNRKDKSFAPTTNDKYNTHSLRKTFSEWFGITGKYLKESGILDYDDTILDLLKEKFKHSSRSVTAHYTDAQEQAFKTICQNLNIGLDVVNDYLYK